MVVCCICTRGGEGLDTAVHGCAGVNVCRGCRSVFMFSSLLKYGVEPVKANLVQKAKWRKSARADARCNDIFKRVLWCKAWM